MKCFLVSRIDLPESLECTRKIKTALEHEGHTVLLEADTASCLGSSGLPCSQAIGDIVIVIGGDGTILRTVQQLPHQIPVIGINHGEVGFLADLEPGEVSNFIKSLASGFAVEERMRLTLLQDDTSLGDALNEALIVTTRPAKMLRFSIMIDGVLFRTIPLRRSSYQYTNRINRICDECRRPDCRPPDTGFSPCPACSLPALFPPSFDKQRPSA